MTKAVPEARIGRFIADLTHDSVPKPAVETITRAFVDTIGVTIAGYDSDAGSIATNALVDGNAPADVSWLLGLDGGEPPEHAALRVGTTAHAMDYDDMAWTMDAHPSVSLVPAILAIAPEAEPSGREVIAAYTAGFETACAIAEPITPGHYEAGWHATSTFGAFGATAAAASLLELDAERTAHALTAAASMSAGLKRNFGTPVKPLHAGLAARSGVTAARLAAAGCTADSAAISGDGGFWELYGPGEHDEFAVSDRWALVEEGIDVKAYPCCYFTHAAIAATQELVANVDVDDIERIAVQASAGAADALPHKEPATGLEAKFSMEYVVASAAVRDRVGIDAFTADAINDPTVQLIRECVSFQVDGDRPYDDHGATVTVETAAEIGSRDLADPPGTYDDPLPEAQFRAKFDECAQRCLPAHITDELYDVVSALPAIDDVTAALSEII